MTGKRGWRFPPGRIMPVTDGQLSWIRRLWFLALALAVVLDIAGTVFALRDAYDNDPQFSRVTLSSSLESDGSVTVETSPGLTGTPPIPVGSYITAIDGRPVPRGTPVWDLAEWLAAPDGKPVSLSFLFPDGRTATHRIEASEDYAREVGRVAPIDRDVRLAARLVISLMTCITLIVCAVMLFVRRPQDPVALLFSFAFLMFAGTIDPPLNLWSAMGMGLAYNVYSCIAWTLLVVGLAVFPDGRFNPRPVRFVLLAAPFLAIPLGIDDFPIIPATIIAFVLPLFLLICQAIKYRRFPPGIERQQIKWAAFGFGSGLMMLTAAFFVFAAFDTSGVGPALWGLLVLALFSFGFMAMALGLLISLLRFRLWEADRVISRSAISAAVTLAVGVIWTLSVDMLKIGVEWVLGHENETVATIAGGILAASIFAPTQALAMRWAKTRIAGDESRIKRLIDRLAVWRATETPEEIGIRTLSALSAAVHCNAAALLVDGPRGLQLLAARDIDQADALDHPSYEPSKDSRFAIALPLEDEDGPIGQLLIGPRSDLNRYNAAQLEGLAALTEPLAESLRAAFKRAQHLEGVQLKLGTVEERLARLEQGGGPRLSPT